MTFCFDIDGVIMNIVSENNYFLSTPIIETVQLINNLFERGHKIILYTARGFVTGKDWKEITEQQLKTAGLKYHEIYFSKPAADYYIDDKFVSLDELKNIN